MDVELVTEGISEDENLRLNDNIEDYTNLEGERCGICMDIVVDRGVLDCCQHWFCFTCIDNWATITNLCPLCQNEFQLITCVPVYDTIGSNKTDEDLYSREDDWSIEGKNNTLSFPSYYIDENAVVCLDSDGCKIRSGSVTRETDSYLDTSIACDSCDIWIICFIEHWGWAALSKLKYHAFCVGFDPEGACENSWLCPRCIVEQVPKVSDGTPGSKSKNHHVAETVSGDCSVEAAFSGKLSVSIADAGETAVVVSFVEENLRNEIQGGPISNLVVGEGNNIDTFSSNSAAAAPKGELSSERISCEPNLVSEKLELSLSRDTYSSLQLDPTFPYNVKINADDKATLNRLEVVSSTNSSATPFNDKLIESGLDLHLGLSVSSSSDADLLNNIAEDQMPGYVDQKSLGNLLSAGETMPDQEEILTVSSMISDKKRNAAASAVSKRKHEDTSADDGESKAKIGSKISPKKVKVEGNSRLMYLKDKHIDSVPDNSDTLSAVNFFTDSGSKSAFEKKNGTANIMDIVRGTSRRRLKGLDHDNSATMSSKERENAAGLRVKKIMKRSDDHVDSFMLVQKLRKEIREAVRNRSSKDFGENIFDPKLLAAFRAVVAGHLNEDKKPPVDVKAKKALLQKGKVRENLTKKIYGIGGRRKRAWTRDCEIEFWKHRCSKISKPEKIQTLRLVLDLLQNDTDKTVVKHEREGNATGSILSRLYLADTSVFPRKDDIKPITALKNVAIPESNAEHSVAQKSQKIPPRNEVSTRIVTPLSGSKLSKKSVLAVKDESVSGKLHQNRCNEGSSISTADISKSPSNQEMVSTSDGIKSDKRKWALELLARRTAVSEKNAVHEMEEDNAILKGNYPLLAQLPKDMRPVLEPIRHNKIPTTVRQAQLYRLTEHLLRKANLQAMCRTGETELAIADATNIEREIANRSNSKLVYVNLCSQELLRRSDAAAPSRTTETNLSTNSVDHADGSDVANGVTSDMEATEALIAAGLLSDTPPGSPHQPTEGINEDAGFLNKIEEDDGPDNVFEMESQPDFDIYGDFEYNLEDDDFVGAAALKISELQSEESKLKVVFSTANVDKSDATADIPNHEASVSIEASMVSSGLPVCSASTISPIVDSRANDTLPQNAAGDEECEELSLAECEELYGPDKEPLFKKYPETALVKPCEVIASEDIGAGNGSGTVDTQGESFTENIKVINVDQCPPVSENSSIHSQKPEDAQRKQNSNDNANRQSDGHNLVWKKVEAYIKEHIRPLCKSGVITVEQYRWTVGKTTEKVMKYHSKDKNANFLIKEGEKVKKLAEQYVEAAQQTVKS